MLIKPHGKILFQLTKAGAIRGYERRGRCEEGAICPHGSARLAVPVQGLDALATLFQIYIFPLRKVPICGIDASTNKMAGSPCLHCFWFSHQVPVMTQLPDGPHFRTLRSTYLSDTLPLHNTTTPPFLNQIAPKLP